MKRESELLRRLQEAEDERLVLIEQGKIHLKPDARPNVAKDDAINKIREIIESTHKD